ncbi:hypothetical protein [Burkholderia sp. LMG 21824]|uniref:hypothetical protein n=1 Tax=Burkholderia sp. LMG 21824 TaxID=3158172 RepID=UPI003C2D1448
MRGFVDLDDRNVHPMLRARCAARVTLDACAEQCEQFIRADRWRTFLHLDARVPKQLGDARQVTGVRQFRLAVERVRDLDCAVGHAGATVVER